METKILDFTGRRREDTMIDNNLLWWSERTREESHMLTLSIEDIKSTLLMAVFAYNSEDNALIAAGGIFLPRTHNQSEPYFDNKKVVEIGTNFVLPKYRMQGIGKQLIDIRLNYAKSNNWVPVSISSNPVVQNIFTKINGILMENDEKYAELRELLCLKRCKNGSFCNACPLVPNCGWIF